MEPRTVQRAFIIPIDTVTPPSKQFTQSRIIIRCVSPDPLLAAEGTRVFIVNCFGGGGGSRTRVWQWKPRLHTVIIFEPAYGPLLVCFRISRSQPP